jgi:hypothetical protein
MQNAPQKSAMQWAHDAGLKNLDPKSLRVRDFFIKNAEEK